MGIDLGAGGVKVVELREEKKRPVLFTYGYTSEKQDVHSLVPREDLTVNDLMKKAPDAEEAAPRQEELNDKKIDSYARKIKAICKAAKTVSKTAVVNLPVSSVFHAVVTLPLVKKEDLDRMLRGELKKFVPMPLEEVAIDYHVIGTQEEQKTQSVLINAVPHSLIAFYSKIFQKTGLILKDLEPESTALTRCLVGRDQAVAMIVDIGAERTSFFIVDNTVPVTHQSIEAGGHKADKILKNILGVEDAEVERIKEDLFSLSPAGPLGSALPEGKLFDIFAPLVEPIMKEIEVSFELYLRQQGNEGKHPEKIILTGGMAGLPFLAKRIADKFKLKCYVGDPWARVVHQDSLKPVLRDIGPRMSVAIGLALRNMV